MRAAGGIVLIGGLGVVGSIVSIRDPAWGATSNLKNSASLVDVSIRAPAWGATTSRRPAYCLSRVSIRAPAWGATGNVADDVYDAAVSIRAPAWGATLALRQRQQSRPCFNSRSRVGSDHRGQGAGLGLASFNSRSRVGSDVNAAVVPSLHGVSIRAPAWGATGRCLSPSRSLLSFNSRSRVGSDLLYLAVIVLDICFNSRSRVGSDHRLIFHWRQ